jgi:hypothetical protein
LTFYTYEFTIICSFFWPWFMNIIFIWSWSRLYSFLRLFYEKTFFIFFIHKSYYIFYRKVKFSGIWTDITLNTLISRKNLQFWLSWCKLLYT